LYQNASLPCVHILSQNGRLCNMLTFISFLSLQRCCNATVGCIRVTRICRYVIAGLHTVFLCAHNNTNVATTVGMTNFVGVCDAGGVLSSRRLAIRRLVRCRCSVCELYMVRLSTCDIMIPLLCTQLAPFCACSLWILSRTCVGLYSFDDYLMEDVAKLASKLKPGRRLYQRHYVPHSP